MDKKAPTSNNVFLENIWVFLMHIFILEILNLPLLKKTLEITDI